VPVEIDRLKIFAYFVQQNGYFCWLPRTAQIIVVGQYGVEFKHRDFPYFDV
jgi:hypothetical protein